MSDLAYPTAVADALRPDAESLVAKLQAIVDKGGDPEVRPEILANVVEQANKVASMVGIEGVQPLNIERKLELIAAQEDWKVAFDGCHKIYVVRSPEEYERLKGYGYDDDDLLPASEIHALWLGSCFLRFVNMADLDEHPWVIEQGESDDDEGDEQQEDL